METSEVWFDEGFLACVALCAGAFLVGSIPWAYLIGRAHGVDIRKVGSGNVGATNVSRALGRKWGTLCFILDFLKGFAVSLLSVLLARWRVLGMGDFAVVAASFGAVAGHVWPVYLDFKGGKGVSTIAGLLLAVAPISLISGALVWFLVFHFSRFVSLASISAAVFLPLSASIFSFLGVYPLAGLLQCMLFLLALLVIAKHRGNIKRLMEGTENKFERKAKKL